MLSFLFCAAMYVGGVWYSIRKEVGIKKKPEVGKVIIGHHLSIVINVALLL